MQRSAVQVTDTYTTHTYSLHLGLVHLQLGLSYTMGSGHLECRWPRCTRKRFLWLSGCTSDKTSKCLACLGAKLPTIATLDAAHYSHSVDRCVRAAAGGRLWFPSDESRLVNLTPLEMKGSELAMALC